MTFCRFQIHVSSFSCAGEEERDGGLCLWRGWVRQPPVTTDSGGSQILIQGLAHQRLMMDRSAIHHHHHAIVASHPLSLVDKMFG